MNEHYTYLLINILAVAVPLLMTFYPKSHFYGKWKATIPAMLIVATVFIIWDVAFTEAGIWGFNERYLTGIYLFNLPIEEVLFFFCIPYACMFSYVLINDLLNDFNIKLTRVGERANLVFMVLFLVVAAFSYNQTYTFTTALLFALFLFTLRYLGYTKYSGAVYVSYIPLLVPFFVVNGLLTGMATPEPIVWYNSSYILGIRLFTIPIEDLFYGLLMVKANIVLYNYFGSISWFAGKLAVQGKVS